MRTDDSEIKEEYVHFFSAHVNEPSMPTFDKTIMKALSVITGESLNTENIRRECINKLMSYPIYPNGEAVWGSLFVFTKATIKNFIAQSICSIQKSRFSEHLSRNVSNEVFIFVIRSEELDAKLNATSFQALNAKKQQSRNIYIRFLGTLIYLLNVEKRRMMKQKDLSWKKCKNITKTFPSYWRRWQRSFPVEACNIWRALLLRAHKP